MGMSIKYTLEVRFYKDMNIPFINFIVDNKIINNEIERSLPV